MKPHLNLIVIRANHLEKTVSFYREFGLSFKQEQHGNGPIHYACEFENLVFELYPAVHGEIDETTRIGFSVSNLGAIIDKLRLINVTVISEPTQSPWGKRAVVQDPDGHKVELLEPASTS